MSMLRISSYTCMRSQIEQVGLDDWITCSSMALLTVFQPYEADERLCALETFIPL